MKNLEKYADFGGQADISVAGVQNLTDEIDFLETQRNAYRAELMAERAEDKERIACFNELMPRVPRATRWAQIMQDIEAMLARTEMLEERNEKLEIELRESRPSAGFLDSENQPAIYTAQSCPKPLMPFNVQTRSAS